MKYSDWVVPSIDQHVLNDDKSLLAKLKMPDPYKTARLPGFLEQCEALVKAKPPTAIGAVAVGPWTIAMLLRNPETMLLDTFEDPQFIHDCMRVATDFSKIWGDAIVNTGLGAREHNRFVRIAHVPNPGDVVGEVRTLADGREYPPPVTFESRTPARLEENEELRALLDSDPFPGLTHGRGVYLTATFLKDDATVPDVPPEQPDQRTRVVRYDRLARAVLAITDTSDPGDAPNFMSWLEKTYGRDITTRSWLTVQRVVKNLES